MATRNNLEVKAPVVGRFAEVLTPRALAFVATLEREFGDQRARLLHDRAVRQASFAAGELPDFPPDTQAIRKGAWQIAPVPADLVDRRVEITGPAERKIVVNALNSGANVFVADFEDANAPTWPNLVQGQINLADFVRRSIAVPGRGLSLGERTATLMVRPRGWHMPENHLLVDGRPVAGGVFDFGVYLFHNAQALLEQGTGPYFYLPKLEGRREAELWDDIFLFAEKELGLVHGTIKATVLVDTVTAAFEMDEILFALREHSAGLNAGRWGFLFSTIKKFRYREEFILPDRAQVTMAAPFLRAYARLLVATAHRRGAHAIGGMAAFLPSRSDPSGNAAALAEGRADWQREAREGFDGTWVSHPDLVPVARAVFDGVLGGRPHQIGRTAATTPVTAAELLDLRVPGGRVTENGLRTNIRVTLAYLESWLRGQGAAQIDNRMEVVATAEISRTQIWQWVEHGVLLAEGPRVTEQMVRRLAREEIGRLRDVMGEQAWARSRYGDALALFEVVTLDESLPEFLTALAQAHLEIEEPEVPASEAA